MYEELCGKTKDHLIYLSDINRYFHQDVASSFLILKEKAALAGFDFYVTSSFRNFSDQLRIWNEKARGKRTLLDKSGNPLPFDEMSPQEIMESILRWSALPGISRHHWGTDFDVVDYNSVPEGYHVELTPQEVDGMFAPFFKWMNEQYDQGEMENFFWPYKSERNGVNPEAWHISHRPTAQKFLKQLSFEVFRNIIESNDMDLKDLVLSDAKRIYEQYVLNIDN